MTVSPGSSSSNSSMTTRGAAASSALVPSRPAAPTIAVRSPKATKRAPSPTAPTAAAARWLLPTPKAPSR